MYTYIEKIRVERNIRAYLVHSSHFADEETYILRGKVTEILG